MIHCDADDCHDHDDDSDDALSDDGDDADYHNDLDDHDGHYDDDASNLTQQFDLLFPKKNESYSNFFQRCWIDLSTHDVSWNKIFPRRRDDEDKMTAKTMIAKKGTQNRAHVHQVTRLAPPIHNVELWSYHMIGGSCPASQSKSSFSLQKLSWIPCPAALTWA